MFDIYNKMKSVSEQNRADLSTVLAKSFLPKRRNKHGAESIIHKVVTKFCSEKGAHTGLEALIPEAIQE